MFNPEIFIVQLFKSLFMNIVQTIVALIQIIINILAIEYEKWTMVPEGVGHYDSQNNRHFPNAFLSFDD
jgi:hypothetical protein